MNLNAEQIQSNWKIFLDNIKTHIPGNRGECLSNFYKRYEERIILMPAAHKKNTMEHFQEVMLPTLIG